MRGQLGANTYQMTFPGQQQIPVGVQQQQLKPEQFDLGKDPLAIREKLTSDLYNAKALLDAVAKDFSRQGIDPFTPDYSQDGGGLAFQTLEKAKANLMYAANALRMQAEADEQEREALMRGDIRYTSGYNPQVDMSTQMNPADVYYSTQLDPRTVANNQRTGQSYYTNDDVAAVNKAVYDPTRKAVSNSYSGEELQYQLGGILPATKDTSYQQLIDRSGGRGSNNTPEIEVLKKVTNLAQGVWPEGTYNVMTKGGKALLENRTMSGEYLGDYIGQDDKGNQKILRKIVKRWVKDPETGEVVIEFDNPDIPAENASNTKGDVIASSIISNNPKYGSAQKMYATARELGYLDDTSSAINEALIPKDADAIREQIKAKVGAESQNIRDKFEKVRNNLKSLENPLLGHNWIIYNLPDGKQMHIAKHKGKGGEKYFIRNWEELGFPSSEGLENLTIDQALQFLDDFKYFDRFLGQGGSQSKPAQPTKVNQELDEDI